MGKSRWNGTAKWITVIVAVVVVVGGAVQQHTSAVARIGHLETEQLAQRLEISQKLEAVRVEQIEQGKLLVRLATKLELEAK